MYRFTWTILFLWKKDNIEVYNKLIKNIGVKSFINEMTSQEEKEYRLCFRFLFSEMKKTKENYQTNHINKMEKNSKPLVENQENINYSLVTINKCNINIIELENKKISKWKNIFLKVISLNFFDLNKKIVTEQQRLENSKANSNAQIATLNEEKLKIEQEKNNIISQFKEDIIKIKTVIKECEMLEKAFSDLVKTKNIPDDIEYEMAEEVFETMPLNKSRRASNSQDSGFDSAANSDSEKESYPKTLNPFSDNYNYENSQSPINKFKKADLFKL